MIYLTLSIIATAVASFTESGSDALAAILIALMGVRGIFELFNTDPEQSE
jgi:hypothetical protein